MKNRYCDDVRFRVSALHHIMARCSTSEVMAFLHRGYYNINAIDSAKQTPLYYAIFRGYRLGVNLLLERGAKMNIQDEDGNSPLHFAVKWGCKDVVDDLLKNGADMEARNKYGQTVLQYAIVWNYRKSFEAIVKLLLSYGAKVNAQDKDGETPLHSAAARRDSKSVLILLLLKGAKINVGDKKGNTPLHVASTRVCKEAITVLLDKGADIKKKNVDGDTPLHSAVKLTVIESVKILLENGADLSARNVLGQTPLHIASAGSCEDILKLLIVHGANLQEKDYCGNTALHSAAESYRSDRSMNILLDEGAVVRARNNYDETPLQVALRKHRHENVETLLDWETAIIADNCGFCHLLSQRFEYDCIELILVKHIIKLISAKIDLGYQISSEDPDIINFSTECSKEFEKMKLIKIGRNSMYEVFSNYADPVFLSNLQLEEAVSSNNLVSDFPKYASLLKVTFKKAKRRLELLNNAEFSLGNVLSEAFDGKPELALPNELLRKILAYLDEINLQNVVTAGEIGDDDDC